MKEIEGIGKLYTAGDIAEMLEVHEMTVMRNYRTGKLNGRKFGKRVYFLEASLQEFLTGKDREIKPAKKRAKRIKPVKVEKESFDLFNQVEPAKVEQLQVEPAEAKINEIKEAMKQAGNHRENASKILKISKMTLSRWLKKYNLSFPKN